MNRTSTILYSLAVTLLRDLAVNTLQKTGIINWVEHKMRMLWVRWIEHSCTGRSLSFVRAVYAACLRFACTSTSLKWNRYHVYMYRMHLHIHTYTNVRSHMSDHTSNCAVLIFKESKMRNGTTKGKWRNISKRYEWVHSQKLCCQKINNCKLFQSHPFFCSRFTFLYVVKSLNYHFSSTPHPLHTLLRI